MHLQNIPSPYQHSQDDSAGSVNMPIKLLRHLHVYLLTYQTASINSRRVASTDPIAE